jgi:nicotinate-nucleotide adenylyltransferase
MTNNILLYFGSFNPVHRGHTEIARFLIDNELCKEVWFVVSPCNPLKEQKDELVSENIRLEMLKLAIAGQPRFKVSDIEFLLPQPSYTVDTLNFISKEYPQQQFSIIIGTDNAAIFAKWKNYGEILHKYTVFVYPRKDYVFDSRLFPQMKLLNTGLYDISSTEIRRFLRTKPELSQWLHPAVLDFILKNNLYIQSTSVACREDREGALP